MVQCKFTKKIYFLQNDSTFDTDSAIKTRISIIPEQSWSKRIKNTLLFIYVPVEL